MGQRVQGTLNKLSRQLIDSMVKRGHAKMKADVHTSVPSVAKKWNKRNLIPMQFR